MKTELDYMAEETLHSDKDEVLTMRYARPKNNIFLKRQSYHHKIVSIRDMVTIWGYDYSKLLKMLKKIPKNHSIMVTRGGFESTRKLKNEMKKDWSVDNSLYFVLYDTKTGNRIEDGIILFSNGEMSGFIPYR